MRFEVRGDRPLIRARGGSVRHIWASVEAPMAPARHARAPVNLALVIDRSGSMASGKLERAKEAARQALLSLEPQDRFSVVSYDHHVDVLVESCLATPANRARAEVLLTTLTPRGATDLFEGCRRGWEQVARHLRNDDLGRCLLLTDGLANQGLKDHDEIVHHVAALRARRVATTTFGLGLDFDESLLQRMAEAGGGNFYFIELAEQIPEIMVGEVGEALEVVVREAAIVVEAPAGVSIDALNDYPGERAGDTWRFELGSLVSGQILDPILAVTLRDGAAGASNVVSLQLDDGEGVLEAPKRDEIFNFAGDVEVDAQLRDVEVDRRVANLQAARTSRDALQRNREGDYSGASELLAACAQDIRGYAADDAILLHIAMDLEKRAAEYGRELSARARKLGHFDHHRVLKERMLGGRSVRRGGEGSIVVLPTSKALQQAASRSVEALRGSCRQLLPRSSRESEVDRSGWRSDGGGAGPRSDE